MREKKELKINVGASSIILILLVFALSIFAVLSIRASHNELKLAEKTSDAVRAYYSADSKAELLLTRIDEIIKTVPVSESYTKLSEIEEVTDVGTDDVGYPKSVTYQISMSETSNLTVMLNIIKGANGKQSYDIQTWKMINTGQTNELEILDDANLWDGEIPE